MAQMARRSRSSGKASRGTRWRRSACFGVSCRGPSASSMSVRTQARTRLLQPCSLIALRCTRSSPSPIAWHG